MEEEDNLGADDDLDDFIDYQADKEYLKGNKGKKKIKYNRYHESDGEEEDKKYQGDLMRTLQNIKPEPIKSRKLKKEVDVEKAKASEDIMANLFADLDGPEVEENLGAPASFSNLINNANQYLQNTDYFSAGNNMMSNITGLEKKAPILGAMEAQGAKVVDRSQGRGLQPAKFVGRSQNKMVEENLNDYSLDDDVMAQIDAELKGADLSMAKKPVQMNRPSLQPAQPNYNNRNTAAPQKGLMGSQQKVIKATFDGQKIYTRNPEIRKEINFNAQPTTTDGPKFFNAKDDLEFYWLDAVEDYKTKSKLHLFGKVATPTLKNHFSSANLCVKNMKRNIFIFKKMDETDMTMDEMREEVESRIKYKHSYIFSRMKMKETKKHYAFDLNVSHGEVTC